MHVPSFTCAYGRCETNWLQAGPIHITVHFPVAARELRAAAHNRAQFKARSWTVFFALIGTAWILWAMADYSGRMTPSFGAQVFAAQSWAAFVFAMMAVNATMDSISSEKREGTLGLLFLTHLTGFDVVIGKLASSMIQFALCLVATLPLLTMPVMLGGIQVWQVGHLAVSLINAMLFSASAGILASSLCVKRNSASSLGIVIVTLLGFVAPLLSYSLGRKGYSRDLVMLVDWLSPTYAQRLCQGALLGLQKYYFWTSVGIVFLISCSFLSIAAWVTPRAWQTRDRKPSRSRLRKTFSAFSDRTIGSRTPEGRALLDFNAYEWLAARQKSASFGAWRYMVGAILLAAACFLYARRFMEDGAALLLVCIPGAYFIQLNLKCRVGGHASHRFCEDRDNNAMELILSTPLTIPNIIQGEFGAIRRHFLSPMIILALVLFLGWFLCIGGVERLSSLFRPNSPPVYFQARAFAIVLCLVVFLFIDSLTLAWTHTWFALFTKTTHARSLGMLTALLGPVSIFAALLPAGLMRFFLNLDEPFYPILFTMAGFVLAGNLFLIHLFRKQLLNVERERLAMPAAPSREPFQAGPSLSPKRTALAVDNI